MNTQETPTATIEPAAERPQADHAGGLQAITDEARLTLDPFGIGELIAQVSGAWMTHPEHLAASLSQLSQGIAAWQAQIWKRTLHGGQSLVHVPHPQDERFQDPIWYENPSFIVSREYYLLLTRWIEDSLYETPGMDDRSRRISAFWMRQFLNMTAPTNYFWGNPGAIHRFINSGGHSLWEGAQRFARDCAAGDVRMVETSGMQVGRDLATTPGQVVLRNRLVELIQYTPSTPQVHAIPLVIVAPWINRYYILDLNEKKSLIKYLVDKGFTVFVTSWKNPTPDMSQVTLDDYMVEGILPCLQAAREICGTASVHAVGYCIGGTLLSGLMAWLARGPAQDAALVSAWTLLTTLTDFTAPGDIEAFITEQSLKYLDRLMAKTGLMDGKNMYWSFRMLRPNSLLWRYAIQNYLYGEDPPPLDVLFWNVDGTRLPAAAHSFYLRELYLNNRLAEPDGITLAGRPVDLRRIDTPLYMVGTEEDHIAPWKETFKLCGLVKGEVRFTLAASGHILGIVSPPVKPAKRHYWTAPAGGAQDPEAWRQGKGLTKHLGSWWEDWSAWLGERCGALQAPPPLGSAAHPPLCPAPGTYVLEK
jgi:polyhydroxyalkanoate synthase